MVLNPGKPDQELLSQSDAVIAILDQLGRWAIFATFFRMIPKSLRDRGYGSLHITATKCSANMTPAQCRPSAIAINFSTDKPAQDFSPSAL